MTGALHPRPNLSWTNAVDANMLNEVSDINIESIKSDKYSYPSEAETISTAKTFDALVAEKLAE